MSSNANYKSIAVLGPDRIYLSHCTWKRASNLLATERAVRIDATTIMLKETKRARKKKMNQIIKDARDICYICGEKATMDNTATIDHVIPKSRNKYADVYENMRCCCDRCNTDKGNMKPIEYIHYINRTREKHSYLSDERIAYLQKFLVDYEKEWNDEHANKGNDSSGILCKAVDAGEDSV